MFVASIPFVPRNSKVYFLSIIRSLSPINTFSENNRTLCSIEPRFVRTKIWAYHFDVDEWQTQKGGARLLFRAQTRRQQETLATIVGREGRMTGRRVRMQTKGKGDAVAAPEEDETERKKKLPLPVHFIRGSLADV